ncbi:cysteine proteinase [Decorospora gaudefroyi]|uniref:ubiquitinyl hydrolase 1 n=1 Tax=Decorospora gaudefroyi TaxID=184978 RepID=A0A6A5KDW3_9PLEO|nr:cysteine proteinase [Decorospora gaudefroyi]
MNGMSRFLSRRDKHHEKRSSKHASPKVRPPSFASFNSLSPLLFSAVDTLPEDCPAHRRRKSSSVESLYHKLPFVLRTSVEDSLLFLHQKLPCRAALTPIDLQHPTTSSSDHPLLQPDTPNVSSNLYTLFASPGPKPPADKDGEKKVKMLLSRLHGAGIAQLEEEHVEHALAWHPSDIDKAYHLLVLAHESLQGELKKYNPGVPMLGAINRNMVTCYLDALLFAMFARLDSFEGMLYENFEDEPRKKLAAVLRLWVNLLRTGQLIKPDLTKQLQDSLANCGWEQAALVRQQDASEAFTFITGALELPLLTLKMDIYHTGREDKEDDHKFVNERLLEVAIPEQEGDHVVTLEDCLETYFNNRIEVKRYLQRQNTIASMKVKEGGFVDKDSEKDATIYIETMEMEEALTPIVSTPVSLEPTTPLSPVRPSLEGRRRADSIFGQRYSRRPPGSSKFDEKKHVEDMLDSSSSGRPRSASLLKKEILMPAWQFFSLIPWYTDNVPRTDAQVAAHFSVKRPVLGICLKRYSMLPNGVRKRLDTYIDIPLDIGLPHFISDERIKDEGPLFGNFKLVLQSVVCHRGVSVDSGHYIALVRANTQERPSSSHSESEEDQDKWLRFDDLSNPRVTEVDIKKALCEESPYLLFYQVQPIDEELASRGDPPTYAEAQSGLPSLDPSRETLASVLSATATDTDAGAECEEITLGDAHPSTDHVDEPVSRHSVSSNQRNSLAIEDTEAGVRGRMLPPTPEDQKTSFLSVSRRGSRIWMSGGNKSRPSSPSGENRLSLTLSRLTGRGSKDKLITTEPVTGEDAVIVVDKVKSAEHGQQAHSPVKEKKDFGISRNKSKKEKKDRLSSKSGESGAALDKHKHKHKRKSRPDRECIVM